MKDVKVCLSPHPTPFFIKQIKDILKGSLRFNQSQLEAEENEQITIEDDHYCSNNQSKEPSETMKNASVAKQSIPPRKQVKARVEQFAYLLASMSHWVQLNLLPSSYAMNCTVVILSTAGIGIFASKNLS